MPTTTSKGYQVPVGSDPANVPADILTLADQIDAHSWGGVFTTTQRDLLVAPNLWAGMVIWNSTTTQLEVNETGTAGSAYWQAAPAYVPPSDPAAATPGLRTLGTGPQQAAQGSWLANAANFLSQIGGLSAMGAAPVLSPALTGNPTAPTQSAGDSSTKIATTAFVETAVSAGPWTAFTPTLTNWAPGSSTVVGKYRLVGKTCHVHVQVTTSGAVYNANQVTCSLPFTAINDGTEQELSFKCWTGTTGTPSAGLVWLGLGSITPGTAAAALGVYAGAANGGMSAIDTNHNSQTGGGMVLSGAYEVA